MSVSQSLPSLREVFANDFRIGAAVNPVTIESQKQLLISHVNSLTAENHMKFEHLQLEEGRFTFDIAGSNRRFRSFPSHGGSRAYARMA